MRIIFQLNSNSLCCCVFLSFVGLQTWSRYGSQYTRGLKLINFIQFVMVYGICRESKG